jgi:cytochrome c
MDSMEYNKIAAAVLTAGIAFAGFGIVADNLSHPARLTHTVLDIKGAEPAATAAAPVAEGPKPIEPLLVSAVPADGEAYTKKICVACHNFNEGGGAKVGPDLYGVVGREQASAPGFEYSSALKAHHGKWNYDSLNEWLYKPAAYAKGTKMAYGGLSDDKLRADVIDYLRTLSKSPEPLPTPEQVKAAEAKAAPAPKQAAAQAPAGENLPPVGPLLASADPEAGHAYTKKICVACHNFAEGAGAKVGPDLYGVVGRERASAPGYEYSAALKAKPGKWTYDTLNEWLYKPAAFAKGTKMAYAGLADAKLRADVIDYLRTLSKSPEPLPSAGSPAVKPAATSQPATPQAAPKSAPPPAAPPVPEPATPAPASSTLPASSASKPDQAAAPSSSDSKSPPASAPTPATPASPAAKPAADVPKVSGSSGGANAPGGQATQAGPNQNQPTDAQSQQQEPPQAHKVEPAAPGAPSAQGKPN